MEKVLISGGSGTIGSHLSRRLTEKGYDVAVLTRTGRHPEGTRPFLWNPEEKSIDPEAIAWADHVIHLAGAGIGERRWSSKRKKLIIDSRVMSADTLFHSMKAQNKSLKTFVSSSATGYYGAITVDNIFREEDPPAPDFLGETCRLWEEAADRFEGEGVRTVKIRTGVALTKRGGALSGMKTPIVYGIGSAIGSGKQYIPWIHIEDLCGIIIKALDDKNMQGAYNAVAPVHINNKTFMLTLAHVLHKPFWFPRVPAFLMKIIFGEMADILLEGSRVSSEKIVSAGFQFRFPDPGKALKHLLTTEPN